VTELLNGDLLIVGGETPLTSESRAALKAGTSFPFGTQPTASVELMHGNSIKTLPPMSQARSGHTATLLSSGQVLVVSGATAELYDQATNRWHATSPLPSPRANHSATLLADGRVMVVGGSFHIEEAHFDKKTAASTLIWDPKTDQWSASSDLPIGRIRDHKTTLLPNGNVLLSGGSDVRFARVLELALWDQAKGQWFNAGSMRHDLSFHSNALLPNGNVFLVTGEGLALWSPMVDEKAPGDWALLRMGASVTPLADGRFLVTGGGMRDVQGLSPSFSSQLYDPMTRRWSSTGYLHAPRTRHHTIRLADGRVLLMGGWQDPKWGNEEMPIEIWDPTTGQWQVSAPLSFEYEQWRTCENSYRNGHLYMTPSCRARDATDIRGLPDGRVFAGVETLHEENKPKEYRYRIWFPDQAPPTQNAQITAPRLGGYLTLLDDETLLFIGGTVARSKQASRELTVWNFKTKRWQAAGRLNRDIADPVVLPLGDRRVLIIDQSKKGLVSTAELWNAKTDTVQTIAMPPALEIEETSGRRERPLHQYTWRALALTDDRILLVSQNKTFIAPPPFKQWQTIENAVNPWPHVSPMSVLPNGNILSFAAVTSKDTKERIQQHKRDEQDMNLKETQI
jgi:N-acetylneuraminic acid mutarotase